MSLEIRAAGVLTPAGVVSPGVVIVDASRITYAGTATGAPAESATESLSYPEGIIVPGLVNAHTHSPMVLLRGYADNLPLMTWLSEKIWPMEDRFEPEDVFWGTQLASLEMIASGTTTFADMYFHMGELAKAVAESGLRASLARGMQGLGPNAARALTEAEELYRDWHGGAAGRITVRLGPHAPYTCGADYLVQVRDLAERLEAGVHIHLSETQAEVQKSLEEHGTSPIGLVHRLGLDRVPLQAAHVVHPVAGDAEIIADWQGGVVHCPRSNLKLGSGIAPVPELLAAGVNVALGTDGAASSGGLDLWEESRLASLLAKGSARDPRALPAGRTLELASQAGARLLGLGEDVGSLEAGRKADLAVVDLSRPGLQPRHDVRSLLAYSVQGSDVRLTMVDGRILYRDGEYTTLDEKRIRHEVARRLERLGLPVS